MRHGPWCDVDENDAFAEQPPRFPGPTAEQIAALRAARGAIIDVRGWPEAQQRLRAVGYADVPRHFEDARLPSP